MTDNRKYYYLKLKDSFFDSDIMIVLESMPDGYLFSNILLKLYLRSLKNNGKLMFNDFIPYNPTILAQVTRHQVGTIEKGLQIFLKLGLVEILDNGEIYMLEIQNFIGESSTEGDRKRKQRTEIKEAKKLLAGQMSGNCPPEKESKKDIDKYQYTDTNIQTKEITREEYTRLHSDLIKNNWSGSMDKLNKEIGLAACLFYWDQILKEKIKKSTVKNKGGLIHSELIKNAKYFYIEHQKNEQRKKILLKNQEAEKDKMSKLKKLEDSYSADLAKYIDELVSNVSADDLAVFNEKFDNELAGIYAKDNKESKALELRYFLGDKYPFESFGKWQQNQSKKVK